MLKRTKIIATISDRRCDVSFLKELYANGMNVVRLNTAHQDFAGTKKIVDNVRKISDKIPLLLDTKGPEIRVSPSEIELTVKKGDKIFIEGNPDKGMYEDTICVNYKHFVRDVSVGDKVLIDDGDIEFEVIGKKDNKLVCVAKNGGVVKNKKSVNVPNVHIKLPSLNEKDKGYIDFAIKNKLDFIAHSFVRSKEDLLEIQKVLDSKKSKIKLISKIENQEGVDNIDEILDHSYGIMIARGDLGIEIAAEKLPVIQRMIIKKCIERRKPVIVATQMLHTMMKNPRPTRAEVSDIANAVYLGADAIMLSGETTNGDYPLEAVQIMTKIATEIEANKEAFDETAVKAINNEIPAFLTKSAVRASLQLPVKAIITDTATGRTARYLSSYRGKNPIFALCYNDNVMRELALSYGVFASYSKIRPTIDGFIKSLVIPLIKKEQFKMDDLMLVIAGSFGNSLGASFIEISTVKNLIGKKRK